MSQETNHRMKIGLILPLGEGMMEGGTSRWFPSTAGEEYSLLTIVQRAEELGFDSIWLVDHLQVERQNQDPMGCWECWSLVSAIAAATSRVEIGTLVLCNSFRNPALVAKMAETVDEISGGRVILGLGAGHHEPEYRAYGFPYDHRVSRFEEAIQIIHGLLKDGQVDFDGLYYQVRDCVLRPRGPRPQGPPIMVGTTGQRMLRLTAQYADVWNVYFNEIGNDPENLIPLNETLDANCREIGRDPATLERTASFIVGMDGRTQMSTVPVNIFTGSHEEIAAKLRGYAEQGISHVQVRVEPNTLSSVEALAPVLEMIE